MGAAPHDGPADRRDQGGGIMTARIWEDEYAPTLEPGVVLTKTEPPPPPASPASPESLARALPSLLGVDGVDPWDPPALARDVLAQIAEAASDATPEIAEDAVRRYGCAALVMGFVDAEGATAEMHELADDATVGIFALIDAGDREAFAAWLARFMPDVHTLRVAVGAMARAFERHAARERARGAS